MLAVYEIRIARNMENFLVKRLVEARKRVWVISPWLSSEYVDLLIVKAREGVEVKIFTTDDALRPHLEALSKLIYIDKVFVKPGNPKLRAISAVAIAIGLILAPINYVFLALAIGGLVLYAFSRDRYKRIYRCKLGEDSLFVYKSKPTGMLHAKVYIVDNAVALGSVNLTRTSILNNIEVLVWISDELTAESMVREISEMEKRNKLERASLSEIVELVQRSISR